MPLSRYSAFFYPTDLAILQKVFDQVSRERGILPGSPEGEALAADIVRLRTTGLEEEEELLNVLSKRRKRYLAGPPDRHGSAYAQHPSGLGPGR